MPWLPPVIPVPSGCSSGLYTALRTAYSSHVFLLGDHIQMWRKYSAIVCCLALVVPLGSMSVNAAESAAGKEAVKLIDTMQAPGPVLANEVPDSLTAQEQIPLVSALISPLAPASSPALETSGQRASAVLDPNVAGFCPAVNDFLLQYCAQYPGDASCQL